jgi:hypothetical protein
VTSRGYPLFGEFPIPVATFFAMVDLLRRTASARELPLL